MTWWNRKSKPADEPDPILREKVKKMEKQQVVMDELVEKLKDPEPDLSTKPPDKIGYCFGYVCPKKHVNQTFENISVDGYKERRACQTCGSVASPAVVRRTSEARWANCARANVFGRNPEPRWAWYNSYASGFGMALNCGDIFWTKYEFVHYLDTPKRKVRKK